MLKDKYMLSNTVLGSGGFSKVYLGTDISTGKSVAIKKILLANASKNNRIEKIKIELDIFKNIKHPNIVEYIDFVETSTAWYIIMEHCNMGTLENVIDHNKKLKNTTEIEKNTWYYMSQLRDAIEYLNTLGIIHRDIKPANILLTKKYMDSDADTDFTFLEDSADSTPYHYSQELVVKLSDFGMSRTYNSSCDLMSTMCGTPLYMAPEQLKNNVYDDKADVWSIGVLIYQLIHGIGPVSASNFEMLKHNTFNQTIDFHHEKKYTSCLFILLKQLLSKDPKLRLTIGEFVNHQWFDWWTDNINDSGISTDDIVTSIEHTSTSNPMNISGRSVDLTDTSIPQYVSPGGKNNFSKMKVSYGSASKQDMIQSSYFSRPSSFPPKTEKKRTRSSSTIGQTNSIISKNSSTSDQTSSMPDQSSSTHGQSRSSFTNLYKSFRLFK